MDIDPYFIVKTPKGYYCSIGDFYLDPGQPVKHAIITHAHGDHAIAGNDEVYCTQATAVLMQLRLGDKAAKRFYIQSTENHFSIGNINITLYHAGHIIGSAMVLMEYNSIKYLYTGDFKLQHDPTCSPLNFVQADVLITETTFANPKYKHPKPATALAELMEEKHTKLTIGAYALGKAQHITALLQNHPQYEVFVHPNIVPIHHLYQQQGVNLGAWKPFNQLDFRRAKQAIFIVPPAIYNRLPRKYTDISVFATGWEQRSKGKRNLPISDHADWPQLMTFISKVQARRIYTVHGDGNYLAKHLKNTATRVELLPTQLQNQAQNF